MTDIFLRTLDATPTNIVLLDPTAASAASVDHPAVIAVTLDDAVFSSSTVLGHTSSATATLGDVVTAITATSGHVITLSTTLDDVVSASSAVLGHVSSSVISLDDVVVEIAAIKSSSSASLSAVIDVQLDGVDCSVTAAQLDRPAGGFLGRYKDGRDKESVRIERIQLGILHADPAPEQSKPKVIQKQPKKHTVAALDVLLPKQQVSLIRRTVVEESANDDDAVILLMATM